MARRACWILSRRLSPKPAACRWLAPSPSGGRHTDVTLASHVAHLGFFALLSWPIQKCRRGTAATAIERAPFLPAERTAKKWLSVDTPFRTVSPGRSTNSNTDQRGSVVSRHRTSKPARSESSGAFQETLASGVTAPPSVTSSGGAAARDYRSLASSVEDRSFGQ